MREVVITDIKYRMTLTAIWSLGKKGISITAVEFDDTKPNERIGFFSKYISNTRVIPSPKRDESLFVSGLISVGKEIYQRTNEKPVLIIPGSATHGIVTKYQSQFKCYFDFNLVTDDILNRANNTYLLSDVAKEVGVPFPETTWLYETENYETLAERIHYPVVIKYREGEKLNLKPYQRYKIVKEKEAFIPIYAHMHAIQKQPLVQAYISGEGYGVSVVFDKNHEPAEIFCHHRIREYPVSGGPSSFCESIWDDRMVRYAIALLKKLEWQGFAMVEFKGDLEGDLRLMEINPRFWGSMPLSLLSDCDLPMAYYNSVLEKTTLHLGIESFNERYKLNTKMQYILQDLSAFSGYFKMSKNKIVFTIKFLGDLFNPKIKDGIFRWSDCKPGLKYMTNAIFKRK